MNQCGFFYRFLPLCVGIAIPCIAGTIRLDFQGTIETSAFASVGVNSPFSGYVYYDTGTTPFLGFNGTDVASAFYLVPQTFFLSVGASTIVPNPSSVDTSAAQVIDHDALQPQPPGATDSIIFQFGGFEITGSLAAEVQGNQNFFLSFMGLPTVLDSAQLPAAFPGLGQWNTGPPDTLVGFVANPHPQSFRSFNGELTSLSSAPVPEPSFLLATPLLLALGYASRRMRSS